MNRSLKVAAAVSVASITSLPVALASLDDTPSAGAGGSAAGGWGATSKVGMAYDVGGRGDQSFNDSAAAGLDKAKSKRVSRSRSPPRARRGRVDPRGAPAALIEAGYNNIVAVGFAYAPSVAKVAKDNPEVKFALIDSTDAKGANIQNVVFSSKEGSYLAGVVAAKKSKTHHIGFVGGVQVDLIKKFEAGYTAGAKATDEHQGRRQVPHPAAGLLGLR